MPRRVLLDESIPVGLTRLLPDFDVKFAPDLGWSGVTNGRLLDEAERAGFEVMVTADQNIRAQQRLSGRSIALVVCTTNHWDTIRADPSGIAAARRAAGQGAYIVVPFPKAPRRRRVFRPPTP